MFKNLMNNVKNLIIKSDFYYYLILILILIIYILLNIEYIFILIEIFIFLGLIILVLTDERFSINRKFFFIVLCLILFIISFYIDKAPMLIIKDLFWYSLVLNGTFIIHVLVLSRAFNYCWKNHYEYLGFLISRISYLCSIWGIIYFLKTIQDQSKFLYLYRGEFIIENVWYPKYDIKNTPFKKNYVKYMRRLYKENKIIEKIYIEIWFIFFYLIWFILCILMHFSLIFHNYSLILLGKNINEYSKKTIIKIIIIFISLFIVSLLIGIPRLYILWIIQLIIEMFKILTFEYIPSLKEDFKKKDFIDKIKRIYNYPADLFFKSYYKTKFWELDKIYEISYHKFFMFDLSKFLLNKYEYGDGYIWGTKDTIYENYDEKINYPIRKVYKYYPWEEMAYDYFKFQLIINSLPDIEYPKDWTDEDIYIEAIKWSNLINIKNKNEFLVKIFIIFNPEWKNESYQDIVELIESVKELIEIRIKNN